MTKSLLAALLICGVAPAALAESAPSNDAQPVLLAETALDDVTGGLVSIPVYIAPVTVQTNVGIVTTPTIATSNAVALAGSVFGNAGAGSTNGVLNIVTNILGQENSSN